MEVSYIFSKKAFLIFPEIETSKKNLYISGNETFLYFQEMELSYISVKVYSEP